MAAVALGASAQVSPDAPPPLPGSYKVHERVFYMGQSQTFGDGDKLVHGQQGEVKGVMRGVWKTHLAVLLPGNKGYVGLLPIEVCRLRSASAATADLWGMPRPHTRR